MFRMTMPTMVFVTLAACGTDEDHTLSGRVNALSFPERVTEVRAIADHDVVRAPVDADGDFTITLPAGDRYRIEMVSALRASPLVFPRTTGVVDTSLFIAGDGRFGLGGVHYAKDLADGPGGDAAIADNAPPDSLGDGDGEGKGGEGDGDGGGGGEGDGDGGGGGQDTGTGGGQDTGGGGGGG